MPPQVVAQNTHNNNTHYDADKAGDDSAIARGGLVDASAVIVPATRRFTSLFLSRPDLTVAQIINSNNYSQQDIESGHVDLAAAPLIPEQADVVVAGAGIASLLYAIHVKTIMPEASVVVLEKASAPSYKIGESTLSPFTRYCQSHILPVGYMLRLFNLKDGLDFVYCDRNGKDVYYQDIGGLDYSFQMERKVSELMLTLKAQKLGVKVFYGVSVDGTSSDISGPEFKNIRFKLQPAVQGSPSSATLLSDSSSANDVKDGGHVLERDPGKKCESGVRHSSVEVYRPGPKRGNGLSEKRNLFTKLFSKISKKSLLTGSPPSPTPPCIESDAETSLTPRLPSCSISATTSEREPETTSDCMIRAKVVGDGTGLAKTLARREAATEAFEGINFTSHWAYFEENMNVEEKNVSDWTHPATNHTCFPAGWMWWIRLISWESTPRPYLMDMIQHLLDHHEAGTPAENLPTIQQLAATFKCSYKYIVSIGVVVQDESLSSFSNAPYTRPEAGEGERRFWGIIHSHPVVEKLLRESGRYQLLEKHYGQLLGTYFTRRHMSYKQTVVAGDGWFAFGNAAGFTSPLFSPGINAIALPTAFLAGNLTAKRLREGDRDGWKTYQEFVVDRHIMGLRTVDLVLYNMFRDSRFFMHVFPIYFANGMADITKNYVHTYVEREIGWGIGCGEKYFKEWSAELLPLISGRFDEPVSDDTAAKVIAICSKWRDILVAEHSHATKYSLYMRRYGDDMKPDPGKTKRVPGDWGAVRCVNPECRHANAWDRTRVGTVATCIACGCNLPDEECERMKEDELIEEVPGLAMDLGQSGASIVITAA